jgi:hypothetical protein
MVELAERHEFISTAMNEPWENVAALLGISAAEARARSVGAMRVSTLVPFADWDFYVVKDAAIVWQPNSGQNWREVVVPPGFVTDLASIPRLFWQILRPTGRYAYAAVVHDYLYWTQIRSREEADQIFRQAMADSKVEPSIVQTLYQAVRQFGELAWAQNTRRRKSGECRFLRRLPDDFTITWEEWKKRPEVFTSDCNR